MKKYISYFRMWLVMGLQYRAAAFGGIVTQFFWGFMEIAAMHAFHDSNPAAYPMTMEATCSYIWFQQAFIAMLSARIFDSQILDSVRSGDIAYELCRPVSIYSLWFSRSTASRLSAAGLRCIGLGGLGGGMLRELCDVYVALPESETYLVQELTLPVYHAWCRMLEWAFWGVKA